jgi:O-glycosyl hydrolase
MTTAVKNVEQETAITVTNNTFTYTIPAQSVVTFVEQ